MNWVYTLEELVEKRIIETKDVSEDKLPNYIIVPFMHNSFKKRSVLSSKKVVLDVHMVGATYMKVVIKKQGRYINTFYILEEIEAAAKDVKTLPKMLQKYGYLPEDEDL